MKTNFLDDLEQYHFERSEFCEVIEEIYPTLEDDFQDYMDKHLDNFVMFRHEDEFYILHRASGTMVNWYKHLGRTNTCNKDLTINELRLFIAALKTDTDKDKTTEIGGVNAEELSRILKNMNITYSGTTQEEYSKRHAKKFNVNNNKVFDTKERMRVVILSEDEGLLNAFKRKIRNFERACSKL